MFSQQYRARPTSVCCIPTLWTWLFIFELESLVILNWSVDSSKFIVGTVHLRNFSSRCVNAVNPYLKTTREFRPVITNCFLFLVLLCVSNWFNTSLWSPDIQMFGPSFSLYFIFIIRPSHYKDQFSSDLLVVLISRFCYKYMCIH